METVENADQTNFVGSEKNETQQPEAGSAKKNDAVENDEPIRNEEFKYKLLTEKKKAMEEARQLRERLKEIETKKLEESQKYKELYEAVKKENEQIKNQVQESIQKEQMRKKQNSLSQELRKLGVKQERMDWIMQRLSPEELNAIKYDEEHNLFYGQDELASAIKQNAPEFFGQGSVRADQSNSDLKTAGESYESIKDIPLTKRKDKNFMAKWYESQGIQIRK